MRKLLGHILALVLLLASLDVCNGQNVVRSTMDGDIERYEMLCELCLNLKTRIRQGEDISKNEAQTFINRFLSMNKDLKDKEHEMTALQRRKFSAISLWFSTGQKLEVAEQISTEDLPSVKTATFSDILSIDPAVGTIEHDCFGGSEAICNHHKTYILLTASYPDTSYGLSAGHTIGRWGLYGSFRSNYLSTTTSYSCLSDSTLSNGSAFWSSGNVCKSNMATVAGVLFRMNRWATIYTGVGYGWRKMAWEDIDGRWADVSDWSLQGMAVDAGFMISCKHLAFSAGVTSISFKSASMTFGFGLCF